MTFLRKISLFNFRNIKELTLDFEDGLNAIIGPNGIGKTSLLEAIHFLSIGRSFRTTKLQEVIKKGADRFAICATFLKDSIEQSIFISYDGTSKIVKHNSTTYSSFSELLGLFQTVVYSPFDIEIIHGAPHDRRKFLNILIAQSSRNYAYHLTRYTKALLNRNSLLKKGELSTIEIWEEELIKSGNILQEKRGKIIDLLSDKTKELYTSLANQNEDISFQYKPSKISREIFQASREKEVLAGCSLVGPHRDDLHIYLNKLLAKNYGSEGQKRTIIAALKLAEKSLLPNSIFLIDDFGVHLDKERKLKFEEKIQSQNQVFLTSPFQLEESKQAFLHFLNDPPLVQALTPQ